MSPQSLNRDLVENLGKVLGPLLFEPRDGVLLGQALPEAHAVLAQLPPPDAHARALHHHVEIHTVDARVGVILNTEIDVLRDTETPVPVLREVLALELELLDSEALGDDVLGLTHIHKKSTLKTALNKLPLHRHRSEAEQKSCKVSAIVYLLYKSTINGTFENVCLLAAHGHVGGNLLVTPDAERAHRVPSCKKKIVTKTKKNL